MMYKFLPGPWNSFSILHYAFEASGCQSICLQQELWMMMSLRQSRLNQTSLKTDFTMSFSKCWATSMEISWAWRVHLRFVWTSPAGGSSSKVMSSTRQHLRRRCRRQTLLRQQPGRMVPAPAAPPPSLPEAPTPPAGEGADAGAGDPAPC